MSPYMKVAPNSLMHHALAKIRWAAALDGRLTSFISVTLLTSCWQLRKQQQQQQMRLWCIDETVDWMGSVSNRLQLSAVLSCGVLCGLGSPSTVDRCFVSEATKLDEAARWHSWLSGTLSPVPGGAQLYRHVPVSCAATSTFLQLYVKPAGWSGTLVGEYWSYVVQLPASVLAWLSLLRHDTTVQTRQLHPAAPRRAADTADHTYHLRARHRPCTPRLASCTSEKVDTKTTRKCISVFGQTNLLRLWLFLELDRYSIITRHNATFAFSTPYQPRSRWLMCPWRYFNTLFNYTLQQLEQNVIIGAKHVRQQCLTNIEVHYMAYAIKKCITSLTAYRGRLCTVHTLAIVTAIYALKHKLTSLRAFYDTLDRVIRH